MAGMFGPGESSWTEADIWQWCPTWKAFRDYHIKQIGYLACSIQLFGATLYGITGVVALPGVLSSLAPWQELGAYWVPQVIASCCFLTAGVMFTLETQDKWYKPLPNNIGWWIGAWATLGSCGFLWVESEFSGPVANEHRCSACFGIHSGDYTWSEYQVSTTTASCPFWNTWIADVPQSSLSSMWGSFAYLCSALLQVCFGR